MYGEAKIDMVMQMKLTGNTDTQKLIVTLQCEKTSKNNLAYSFT
jgi:hypothetical protein